MLRSVASDRALLFCKDDVSSVLSVVAAKLA